MSYTALRFDTAEAEVWSDALLEAGALAVEVTDARAGTPEEEPRFGEPTEASSARWELARLVALFAAGADAEAALAHAAAALGRSVPRARTDRVDERDWVRLTQSQFGPIAIGERLEIVPSWSNPSSSRIAIRLDPGLAFGTGSHPTTRLCLEWLADHLRGGESVLDYGCGSGILAIAAAKLGASRVVGADLDPQALRASRDNARVNGVAARFVAPDALKPGRYSIVVANILANPLILLAPVIATRVAGQLALCGILDAQVESVATAYSPWFTLAPWRRAEGWTLIAAARTTPGRKALAP